MCTTIKVDYNQASVIGRTMDYEVPLDYNPIYLPRGYEYGEDLLGQALYGKYRVMGLSFENRKPLKDGINEHGLAGVTNVFSAFNLYSREVLEGKKNISSLNYMNYALMNYKSVEELVEDLENINLASKNSRGEAVISPDFHFMFVDQTKRSVVVEPRKGQLIAYENPYGVMTNSPAFPSHIRKLKKTFNIDDLDSFNSAKDLPGGYDPSSRFLKAFYILNTNQESESSQEALSHAYNIMSAMAMPNGFVKNKKYNYRTYTRYICAYDTGRKLLTLRSETNPRIYSLGFEDIENLDKRQDFFLNKKFSMDKLT